MKLSEVSIRRPVLATVMSLAIVLVGALAFTGLPVREYPDVDPPVVSIRTLYRGASPSVVETEITEVIEEQLATLEGVKRITSSSQEQGSVITVEFHLDRAIESAANDVRDKVSRIRGSLPTEADDPVVEKVDVNAQPIFWLALSSDTHSALAITDLGDTVLKERLQRLPGVGSVFLGAERREAMRIWLDAARMAAAGLTVQDVEATLRRENAEIPGGRIEGTERELTVRTRGDLRTPTEFAAVVLARNGERVVRLGDVARVEIGAEDERSVARFNGRNALGLGIVKQGEASTLEVAAAVRESLPELRELLPEGMRLDVAYDSSTFIQESLDEVSGTLLLSVALVVVVILVFLRSWRATVIPTAAIPVSIVGTFAVAWAFGFSVNILTLLALVLAIGLVVDDAIVVLENCHRHLEMGKTPLRAAFDGSREIGFAVVATTIALVAVFIPLSLLTSTIGRLFRELGTCVAVAVLISGFVALTLAPALCALLLRRGPAAPAGAAGAPGLMGRVERLYERTLRAALSARWLVGAAALAVVGLSVVLFRGLPKELVPVEDRGFGFGVVIAPEGATLDYTDRYMKQVESVLLSVPERNVVFSATGLGFQGPGRVTNGFVFLNLKPREERERSQQQVVQELFPRLFGIPGVLAFVFNPPSLGQDFGSSPVEYVLQADSYEELGSAVAAVMDGASRSGHLVNLDTDLRLNKPGLDIHVDRDRASQLGVSVRNVGETLETYLGGRVVTEYKKGSKQHDVIAQLEPSSRSTPDTISVLPVRGATGLVPLGSLVDVEETVAPKELNHFNRVRSATITASLAPGSTLGQALDELDRVADERLPKSVRRQLKGQSHEFRQSSGLLYGMFFLSVVFIYLVLAAQFESFLHPLTILLSVPLAVFGALAALAAFGQTLNIYSEIGLIMLIGLVTKNAILIVEYANQLRADGRSKIDAVIAASRIRLRPILMTTLSTIFGILPIALGLGAGAESRRPLGIAVVGGMTFSTLLTLIVVPVAWTLLAGATRGRSEEAAA